MSEELNNKLKEMKEWHRAVVFDHKGVILAKKECDPSKEDL